MNDLPPYKPSVSTKTQAYQIAIIANLPKLILSASTWTYVVLSRLTGAADSIAIGMNNGVTIANGAHLEPNVPMEIILAPGDNLYYRSTITGAPISVLACGIPGVSVSEDVD